MGKRLFTKRLEVIAALDKQLLVVREGLGSLDELRKETAALLRDEVAAMNLDNFIVRPRRRLVEKYAASDAWATLPPESLGELASQIAGLPSEIKSDDEEAKRFDLLMLNLQLAQLRSEPGSAGLRDRVKAIAALLEETSQQVVSLISILEDVRSRAIA